MTKFNLNGRDVSVHSPDDAPLLWVIRDELGLTGTKFGCGIGMCGACTVHVDGRATRSCITAVGAVAGAKVTTIEGLHPEGTHPLQTAWIELQVPQCGYCQSGQIMQAATLLQGLSQSQRPGHQRGYGGKCLPLHDVPADPQGHPLGSGENAAHHLRRSESWLACLRMD